MVRRALLLVALAACERASHPPAAKDAAPPPPTLTITADALKVDGIELIPLRAGEIALQELDGVVVSRLRTYAATELVAARGPVRLVVDPATPFATLFDVVATIEPVLPRPELDGIPLATTPVRMGAGTPDALVVAMMTDRTVTFSFDGKHGTIAKPGSATPHGDLSGVDAALADAADEPRVIVLADQRLPISDVVPVMTRAHARFARVEIADGFTE